MKYYKFLFLFYLLFTSLHATEEHYAKVFEKQIQTTSYLHEINPPLLILFSGTPGMGKTWLAKNLEEHFKAIRWSSDEARKLFKDESFDLKSIGPYRLYSLSEIVKRSSNNMIIVDGSCDRRYESYLEWAKKNGFNVFVIKLEVPRDTVEKRIITRGDNVKEFLNELNRSWNDYENFNKAHPQVDYVINNASDETDLEHLYSTIESKHTFKKLVKGSEEYLNTKASIISYVDHGQDKEIDVRNNISEILPGLYIGNQIAASTIVKHHANFISRMITLRSQTKPFKAEEIVWKGIDIEDSAKTSIRSHFEEVYNFIEATEKAVLVHCREGCSRSTTVVIAYLMKKFDLSFEVAYSYVKKKHPRTIPNKNFTKQLMEYEFSLRLGI